LLRESLKRLFANSLNLVCRLFKVVERILPSNLLWVRFQCELMEKYLRKNRLISWKGLCLYSQFIENRGWNQRLTLIKLPFPSTQKSWGELGIKITMCRNHCLKKYIYKNDCCRREKGRSTLGSSPNTVGSTPTCRMQEENTWCQERDLVDFRRIQWVGLLRVECKIDRKISVLMCIITIYYSLCR
jgi:hypothetical protein